MIPAVFSYFRFDSASAYNRDPTIPPPPLSSLISVSTNSNLSNPFLPPVLLHRTYQRVIILLRCARLIVIVISSKVYIYIYTYMHLKKSKKDALEFIHRRWIRGRVSTNHGLLVVGRVCGRKATREDRSRGGPRKRRNPKKRKRRFVFTAVFGG